MAKYPGLMRRGTKWYLRAWVPEDLQHVIGRKDIWKSLRTGDYSVAKARYIEERVRVEREFAAARNGPPPIGGEEVRQAVADWFASYDQNLAGVDFNTHGPGRRDALDQSQVDWATVTHGEEEQVLGSVQAVADEILIGLGWPWRFHEVGPVKTGQRLAEVDKANGQYWDLCALVRRAMAEALRRQVARLGGPQGVPDPMLAAGPTRSLGVPQDQSVTLAELVDRFLADPTRSAGAKADGDYHVVLRLLGEFVPPDTPVQAVTRDHCRQVAALLKRMPANASKKPQFRGCSPLEAAVEAERLGVLSMSPATANSYISKMSALFRWAAREDIVGRNVAEGLLLPEDTHKRDARRPFTLDQLNRILASEIFHEPKDRWDHRQWVFLLGLLQGLRLNEACTLRCDDVVIRDGVQVILIQPDEEGRKKLKTRAARRLVPVHPLLAGVGLLDFVQRQRTAGRDVLFPGLCSDRRGYYSDAYQRWFSRHLEKVGAKQPRTSFHSTRHNFRDQLREANIGRDAVLALGGWSAGGAEEVYGSGLRPSTLAREIAKVQYPLDLSHLHLR